MRGDSFILCFYAISVPDRGLVLGLAPGISCRVASAGVTLLPSPHTDHRGGGQECGGPWSDFSWRIPVACRFGLDRARQRRDKILTWLSGDKEGKNIFTRCLIFEHPS